MNRDITAHLKSWKLSERRKPLLIRGARQVGKTWSVRNFSNGFKYFCEINFEEDPNASLLFENSLDPEKIVEKLSVYTGIPVKSGETLVFFDEIQVCEKALRSLRFFQEKLPALHVIAAGSLLEFAIGEIPSFGVGRIQSLFIYPMSFREFVSANGESMLIEMLENSEASNHVDEPFFSKLTELYKTYLIIGGFPEVVNHYITHRNIQDCIAILDELIQSFRDDFRKYKKHIPLLRIDETFSATALLAGKKFKYSKVNPDLRAYQIKDALELLVLAGLAHKVYHTSAQGIPLKSQINEKKFKVIPCDIGLYQRMLGGNISELIVAKDNELINKGPAAEIITGTELLAYSSPDKSHLLYYWHRENRGSNAEVDYIIEIDGNIIPLEVKSGIKGKMHSLRIFLDSHKSPYGIRVSLENAAEYENIKVVPACALFRLFQ